MEKPDRLVVHGTTTPEEPRTCAAPFCRRPIAPGAGYATLVLWTDDSAVDLCSWRCVQLYASLRSVEARARQLGDLPVSP